jgi:DNA processing protein
MRAGETSPVTTLPAEAYLAALAGFERMTARRLSSLLRHGGPATAFAIASGDLTPPPDVASLFSGDPELAAAWRADRIRREPANCWQQCLDHGIDIVGDRDPRYPPQLLDDPGRPPVLFAKGDLSVLVARRVAIVGTRNATQRGRETAARFGYELADSDIAVVSGLASGIDGAAHRGALAARRGRPIAVVGNGLDRPYPRHHAGLWAEVVDRGVVLSEWPPGTTPDAFRFPLRNRILAALAEVLVVVESRERGGSLITAREAAERGVDVFAVPGPVDSRASFGTNQLLCDGAAPATSTADILVALGLDQRRAGRARFDPRARPRGLDARVVELCGGRAQTVEQVMRQLELGLVDAAMTLARLEHQGWLRETGGWFETVDEWADLA